MTVENLGLSSAPGTLVLHVPAGGPSPGASFEPPAAGAAPGDQLSIGVTTLDHYVAEHGLTAVRLLKVDVEGHELEVFRGATELLERDHPAILFECEIRHRQSGSLDDVFSFLQDLGYEGFMVGDGELVPVKDFDPAKHQVAGDTQRYFNNFWFTPARQRG